ncbi:hypothetical protein KTC96_02470 [Clostridium estertheticum]|uniref:hypothetical protein n=1 Tax=Clostridium estertheticum TaxID=238834 RepID=UPI001C7D36B1|nr:hypothetical protein [Clostridium estertheticum]MBX4261581.1 hypothetical protein [Clostridium estertheticum]WLC70919.1 hypothetical protein KTC96_02470 [Clostridium estertheticum]
MKIVSITIDSYTLEVKSDKSVLSAALEADMYILIIIICRLKIFDCHKKLKSYKRIYIGYNRHT